MNQQSIATAPVNGASAAHELFALTDEQILGIEPETEVASGEWRAASKEPANAYSAAHAPEQIPTKETSKADPSPVPAEKSGFARDDKQSSNGRTAEPPAWLARQMKDPWAGEEARELWEGAQRAQAEAAEYRAAIATPAEAKSLKEIYPAGVEQARAAAERARSLDEFDAAYFGAVGKSAEEVSAARMALAQRMLREDPAAFEAMVLAGVKALEDARKQGGNVNASDGPGATAVQQGDGVKSAPTQRAPQSSSSTANVSHDTQLAAYSEFEKAANAELEKTVGGAIERALRQALPNARSGDGEALTARLSAGVRQEIEKALQGDRQLSEQVAQVLAARRFDETARTQVVRLINERAQQLVPSATKRVLNDWTQATLAAHRSKTEKQEAASSRADLAPAQQGSERTGTGSQRGIASRVDAPAAPRGRIDYKKLTDEQILDL